MIGVQKEREKVGLVRVPQLCSPRRVNGAAEDGVTMLTAQAVSGYVPFWLVAQRVEMGVHWAWKRDRGELVSIICFEHHYVGTIVMRGNVL